MRKVFLAVREYIKKSDMLLLLLCVACSAFGVVLISSATHSYLTKQYIYIQVLAICIGVAAYVIISLIDLDIIADRWKWLLAFNILFMLALIPFGSEGGTGNKSWIRFGTIGVQPAEFVKISFTILLAKQIKFLRSYNFNSLGSVAQLLGHFLLMFGLIIVVSSDMGSALVYFAIFALVVFSAGLKLRWFAAGGALLLLASPVIWNEVLDDYQRQRILAPYFPSAVDPSGLDITWQATQSKVALASGGLSGQGLFKGAQSQSSLLPSKHTDFIFSVAGEELGLIGCCAIILLLTAVIIRCIYVGVRCNDTTGTLVCMGLAGMLIFQVFENIGMCIGLTPVIGITLPFFSYGGSSILTTFASMGVVSGIWLRRKPRRRNYSKN